MSNDIEMKIKAKIAEILGKNIEEITNEKTFVHDLKAGSLEMAELVMELDEELKVTIDEESEDVKIETVQDLIDHIKDQL